MPIIDHAYKAKLLALGVSILHHPPFELPDECIFEPPCSLKWMGIHFNLKLGAFSYAVNGYYFGAEIGRYVSIGEEVQIGRGSHPVNWASTSPVFYQRHEAVLDFTVEEARDYNPLTPYIHPKNTYIGNDVYIGHGALIMPGVRIGDGAVIGARSVVTRDVPSYSIVAGSPAIVRRMRFKDNIIEKFINTKWWRYAFWDLKHLSIADPEQFVDGVRDLIDNGLGEYRPELVDIGKIV